MKDDAHVVYEDLTASVFYIGPQSDESYVRTRSKGSRLAAGTDGSRWNILSSSGTIIGQGEWIKDAWEDAASKLGRK